MNIQPDFTPNFLRLEPTKDRLTSSAGLGSLIESFDQSPLKIPLAASLPARISHRSQGAYRLGLIQLASFMFGHDCLADLEEFRADPSLKEVMRGETAAPRTFNLVKRWRV